jgi:hypothetical protein
MRSDFLVLCLVAAGAIFAVRSWKQPSVPIAEGAQNMVATLNIPKATKEPTAQPTAPTTAEVTATVTEVSKAVKPAVKQAVEAACLPGAVQLAPGFNWANLYEKPSTSSKVLAELQSGELICWRPAKDGFLPVKYGATAGYIVDRKQ